jgi:uncharacterized phosphosugar-binding protein
MTGPGPGAAAGGAQGVEAGGANGAQTYLALVVGQLSALADDQAGAIEQAAGMIAAALADGHRLWVAATSHVLHTELVMRAGGLAAVHQLGSAPELARPMYGAEMAERLGDGDVEPSPGDIALVGTNAGTDAGTVEIAVAARRAGCRVIALTCVEYETFPDVVAEHPSGRRLVDEADLVVDVGGVVGDAIVDLPGLDVPVGPTSGVALVACAWAILVRASELLLARGSRPLVFRSAQLPGGQDDFQAKLARYQATGRGVEPFGP